MMHNGCQYFLSLSTRVLCAGVALMLASSCRSRSTGNELKDETPVSANADSTSGLDVNDLSILFPFDSTGIPYPNIQIGNATDPTGVDINGKPLWPHDNVFQKMIDFATNGGHGGGGGGLNPGVVSATGGLANAEPPNMPLGMINERIGASSGANPNLTGPAGMLTNPMIGSALLNPTTHQIDPTAGVQVNDLQGVCTNLRPEVLDQTAWRVVSIRIDPCAEQGPNSCNVELRLIVRPFSLTGGTSKVPDAIDTSVHLLYTLGKLKVAGTASEISADSRPPRLDSSINFQSLIADVQAIKALSATAVNNANSNDTNGTSGKPLSQHPGLVAELQAQNGQGKNNAGAIGQKIIALIQKYGSGGLTVMTSMQLLHGGNPWVFFQGKVGADGVWVPVSITGKSPQMSIRTAPGIAASPEPVNAFGFANTQYLNVNPIDAALRNSFVTDNPGRFNDPKERVSVNNMDCVSCHVGNLVYTHANNVSALVHGFSTDGSTPLLYVPSPGITGYMGVDQMFRNVADQLPENVVVGANPWNFHNFGPNGADEGGESVQSRTLNEAAESVRFVNEDILGVANPGFVCKASETDPIARAKTHAKLWDCNVKNRTPFPTCAAQICS